MRSLAYCSAVSLVSSRTAPLDDWYSGLLLSIPTRPSCEEMLMIDPPPAVRMAGIAALVPRNTPLALTSITRSHSSTVVSSSRPAPPMPALLTSTSSLPKRFVASRHGLLPGVLAGDVEVHEHALAALGFDRGFDRASLVVQDVTDDDAGALAREQVSLGRAHAPGAAADERDLAGQTHGGRPAHALRAPGPRRS